MFSRTVYITYNGKTERVEVGCNPSDPINKLKELAMKKLEKREELRRKRQSDFILKLWGLA